MSTTMYRPVSTSPATTPFPGQAVAPTKKPTGWIIATITAACLALVGVMAAMFMAFAPTQIPTPGGSANSAVVVHHSSGHPHTHHVTPVNPNPPSDSIKLEQQELGDLNYYNGPINGYYTQATINAVKYLQRDAGLPQTGQMNAATQAALTKMLTNGNNQMAG